MNYLRRIQLGLTCLFMVPFVVVLTVICLPICVPAWVIGWLVEKLWPNEANEFYAYLKRR